MLFLVLFTFLSCLLHVLALLLINANSNLDYIELNLKPADFMFTNIYAALFALLNMLLGLYYCNAINEYLQNQV